MTEKVGRNDPCPCGSGKKYKHCCLRSGDAAADFPWPVFAEAWVLSDLLESSDEFRAYYREQRPRIKGDVYWAEDVTLPSGIDYRVSRFNGDCKVIRLRRVPASEEDALKIAHELHHLVLDAESSPAVGGASGLENLVAALNSMLHDPLVHRGLEEYGFDVWSDYQTELRKTFDALGAHRDAPGDLPTRLRWIFNYVMHILVWRVVREDSRAHDCGFREWFSERYPAVAAEGDGLLELVDSIGYSTAARQRELLIAIIEKYDLGEMLSLRTELAGREEPI